MNRQRLSQWAARLALVGIALNALWPLVANADPRPQLPPVELCSMSGNTVAVQPFDDHAGSPLLPAKLKPQHCAYCASGGCAAAPAGAARNAVSFTVISFVRPFTPDSVCSDRTEFLLAASRAPPSLPLI